MYARPTKPKYKIFDTVIHRVNILSGLYRQSSAILYTDLLKIGRPEVRLLNILGKCGPTTLLALADRASMDKGLVSRATTKLMALEMITKGTDPNDQRRAFITLTDKGKEASAVVLQQSIQRHERAIEALSAEECNQLYYLLDQLIATATEMALEVGVVRNPPAAGEEID